MIDDEPAKQDDDDSQTIVPTKLYIRGLDTLHTDDIKTYIKAHYGPVDKVEWIDDSSANLVFGSQPSARDALAALSTIEIADATALGVGETVPAKPFDGKPEVSFQVRWSVASDRKVAGAAQRSRYYLLHPEHDPEERRRRQQESRARYRDRDGDRRGGRRRRDSDENVEQFDASMYDDAPATTRSRPYSDSEDRPRSYTRENRGKELFAGRTSRRDRSASPLRDRDDDGDVDVDGPSSSRNRAKARSIRDQISSNRSKELFPTRMSGKGGQLDQLEKAIGSAQLRDEDRPKMATVPGATPSSDSAFNIRGMASQRQHEEAGFSIKGAASAKELFPDRFGGSNAGKELLDGSRSKRRQKAQDLFS